METIISNKKRSLIKCSICKKEGHNKKSCKNIIKIEEDEYLEIDYRPIEIEHCTIETECSVQKENILSSNYWENTEAFKSIKNKETQIKYYKRMNSSESVLQIVDLESKPFGSVSEKIIKEIFNIGERTSSQNDGTKNGKKIEIKSARYWAGKNDCVWQHLEPEHDYEYALFVLLDFDGWIVWGIKKSLLMGEMRDKKIVTYQGKQGWWVRKSMIENYLTPIRNINDFDIFINS